VKVLLVSFFFPPTGGGGLPRALKFAEQLPELGIETHVLAPDRSRWIYSDSTPEPPGARVHRARFIGPRSRRRGDEVHGRSGLGRLLLEAQLLPRRLLVPDEHVTWNLTAVPTAIRVARREAIDVVLTSSPPSSLHFVGAAVKRATGAHWVADLRDSMIANPDRRTESLLVRAKERSERTVAGLVARQADSIVVAAEAIGAEMERLRPRTRVLTIPNGCDFDDFAGLVHRRGPRFRITHTGTFLGRRDAQPFLRALEASDPEITARFVGDFRAADREWVDRRGLNGRIELHPWVSRRRSLELQRDSDALLLLLPEADRRGSGVISAKLYEYLAARRPILAAVPTKGAAANLVRRTGAGVVVPPDDTAAIRRALEDLSASWRDGTLAETDVHPELSRRRRTEELAQLLREVA
jgi:glycosyltransferase involved in cell wall biosynthesis